MAAVSCSTVKSEHSINSCDHIDKEFAVFSDFWEDDIAVKELKSNTTVTLTVGSWISGTCKSSKNENYSAIVEALKNDLSVFHDLWWSLIFIADGDKYNKVLTLDENIKFYSEVAILF